MKHFYELDSSTTDRMLYQSQQSKTKPMSTEGSIQWKLTTTKTKHFHELGQVRPHALSTGINTVEVNSDNNNSSKNVAVALLMQMDLLYQSQQGKTKPVSTQGSIQLKLTTTTFPWTWPGKTTRTVHEDQYSES